MVCYKVLRVIEKNKGEKGNKEFRCEIGGILEGNFDFYEEVIF